VEIVNVAVHAGMLMGSFLIIIGVLFKAKFMSENWDANANMILIAGLTLVITSLFIQFITNLLVAI
jgi:hypothetical protein